MTVSKRKTFNRNLLLFSLFDRSTAYLHPRLTVGADGAEYLFLQAGTRDTLEYFVKHPLISPIHANLAGLPPILMQSGECELLRDDAMKFAKLYRAQNHASTRSVIRSEEFVDMVHVFQAFSWLPQSELALKNISEFINKIGDEGEIDWVDEGVDHPSYKLI